MMKNQIVNWELKEIPIKSLKEHPKNPRQIGKDQMERLTNLMVKFGLIDKPIVNADMMLIGGHQRIKCLKKQKVKTVECWVADRLLDEKEVEELMVGLNLHQGKFDFDILANEFDMLDLLKWGFSEEQLLGTCKEAEEVLEEKEKEAKKAKCCPNCGHEL